jgi:hypothetical protein
LLGVSDLIADKIFQGFLQISILIFPDKTAGENQAETHQKNRNLYQYHAEGKQSECQIMAQHAVIVASPQKRRVRFSGGQFDHNSGAVKIRRYAGNRHNGAIPFFKTRNTTTGQPARKCVTGCIGI